jgi:outer membrane protein OmpA-like peptidoglycan-associated protein
MKHFNDSFLEEHENKYFRTSSPYMMAAVLLVILLFFSGSVWHFNNLHRKAGEVTTLTANPSENSEAAKQVRENRLEAQEAAITQFVELKERIFSELIDSLSKSNIKLDIDRETGTMRFEDADFFNSDSAFIKSTGRALLLRFVPLFASVVLSDKYKDYIDQITIEGHSSGEGDYNYNLNLSHDRADSVATYITGGNFPEYIGKDDMYKYLSTVGRSNNEPVMVNGEIDKQKSRRVEFKFRLKDDMLINNMLKAFKGAD